MKRVLIIDDDPLILSSLRDGFKSAGYEVLEASDGNRGIQLYREQPPSLVITDILMPEKDGLEIIRELRRQSPDVKIIAMSGGGPRQGLDFLPEAKLFGADRTIDKPFRFHEILTLAQEVLAE